MIIKNGNLLLPNGSFSVCDLSFGENIENIGNVAGEGYDADGCYVVPGFVDIHTHGAMGEDFSDGDASALPKLSDWYLKNGVTSYLATTMTLKEPVLIKAMEALRSFKSVSSRCAGVHLEGPFLSYAKRGAQNPDNLHAPDYELLCRLNDASGGKLRLVTVAAEQEGAMEFIRRASELCTVSLGHTEADYDTAMAAFSAGASHATHLFNGMPPLHHRKPGVIGAAFDSGATVEIICDGLHIHPSAIRCAAALFKGRYALISDSLRCAGMPDGDYELGGLPIKLSAGVARLLDGTIAGSSINLHEALRLAVSFGLPLGEALAAVTSTPARAAGLSDVGEISVGKRADLLVLDEKLNIKAVFVGGRKLI